MARYENPSARYINLLIVYWNAFKLGERMNPPKMIRMPINILLFYFPEFLTVYFVIYQSKQHNIHSGDSRHFLPLAVVMCWASGKLTASGVQINPINAVNICLHECHHQFYSEAGAMSLTRPSGCHRKLNAHTERERQVSNYFSWILIFM